MASANFITLLVTTIVGIDIPQKREMVSSCMDITVASSGSSIATGFGTYKRTACAATTSGAISSSSNAGYGRRRRMKLENSPPQKKAPSVAATTAK
jgi:hypothetical protein